MNGFSILIPTWNNRPYLQWCIESIRSHSVLEHQIIVLVNEGKDDSLEWLDKQGIEYVHHKQNVGICAALNSAMDLIERDHVVYLNDDMYVLPAWDTVLADEIAAIGHSSFMLSGTMIEPRFTGNAAVVVKDFGESIETFDEQGLLVFHQENADIKPDWSGASWPPNLLPTELWKRVGGLSEAYSPGMYSDPDLSMKLWQEGVRYFKGLGQSRVYHFGSKSTARLGVNRGRAIFLNKWGITPGYFYRNHLQMGTEWSGPQKEHQQGLFSRLMHWWKKRNF